MSRTEALDNVAHRDLRVRQGYAAEFGDAVNTVLVFPTEFSHVQREYPILLRRDSGGQLQAVALLGLDKDENLFLDGGQWNARYVPAVLQRGPFLIGFRKDEIRGELVNVPVIHVDLAHPRISHAEGEPIFLRHGGNSPCLERANRFLQIIYTGTAMAGPMYSALEAEGLVEVLDMDVDLDGRVKYKLPGFLTVSQERFAGLGTAALERLHAKGYLQPAILLMTSLANVYWLMELKNRKRSGAGAASSAKPADRRD
jgi:hypothetical protein